MHVIAATALEVPELSIDMDEGKQFMGAVQNVARHYSVETTQKTLDWIALFGTGCMIYGTRFGAYMLRKRSEAQERQHPGATVYQMPVVNRPQPAPAPTPKPQAQPAQQPVPQQSEHIVPEMEFEAD